jgi:hypothetical protein
MAAGEALPLAVRRAAWDALWRILLSPRITGDLDPSESSDTTGEERVDTGARR